MRLTKNGVSTTKEKGIFAYEEYGPVNKKRVQWDYRDRKGKLHSGVSKTLPAAMITAEKESGERISKKNLRECE